MSARGIPASGDSALQNELLAQLGLPPSAAPEDVDQTHEAVSEYLATAPASIRGWAHAQAAALDAAYLTLTDPAGLQGSALRSPTRPPTVVPGGPATPPARRDSVPVAPPPPAADLDDVVAEAAGDDANEDDLAALYASVTPSAHADMGPERRRARAVPAGAPPAASAPGAGGNGWKKIALGGLGLALVVGIAFTGYTLGGGGTTAGTGSDTGQAAATPPAIDQAKVAALMQQLQANPDDPETLLSLADEFYAGEQYSTAAQWLDKLLAKQPENVQALLARGAVSFNLGDLAAAKASWNKVAELEPDNQEVHYDLGFLYLNQAEPDWAGVQREWTRVVEIDATTSLAQTAQKHLDSLVASSMIPAPAGGASAAPSGSPAANASGAPAAAVSLSARDLAFSTKALSAKADQPFAIRFDNLDDGIPHNVEIRDAKGTSVFKGELVTGPGKVDYQVPALAAGTYTFLCTVHPNMTGTLTVAP